jgi:hypothetical protein
MDVTDLGLKSSGHISCSATIRLPKGSRVPQRLVVFVIFSRCDNLLPYIKFCRLRTINA